MIGSDSDTRRPDGTRCSVHIVTKSFAPDAKFCDTLVASSERFASPSIGHTLVVPRQDRALFEHLVSSRTRLIFEDEVLPEVVRRVRRKVWFVGMTPVRSWVFQQIVKLSLADAIDADVLVIVDSDSYFCRPFDESVFVDDRGRARLFANPGHPAIQPHQKWHRTTARLLGLPEQTWFGADYVTHAAVWHRPTLARLTERIAAVTGRPWHREVARSWNVSEYTLYGVFAQHVLPEGDREIFPTHEDLAHSSWSYDVRTPEGRAAFVEELEPHHIVIGIQSKEQLSAADRRRLVASFEAAQPASSRRRPEPSPEAT